MSNQNMRIWDDLGVTDPENTKSFKRAGGFSGTAIKPMWSFKRMTQRFGPAGLGWGPTEPQFQVIQAEGELMVYCTAGLWYKDADSPASVTVYGVGGDKVMSQVFEKDKSGNKVKDENGRFKTYAQTSDEAFKAAYTDALSNAMKLIGVGADVHMGRFDDNKYLREAADSFDDEGNRIQPEAKAEKPKIITKTQRDLFVSAVKEKGISTDKVKEVLTAHGFSSSGEITVAALPVLTKWVSEYAD